MAHQRATVKADPAVQRAKVVNIGGQDWIVRDDRVPVHFADFVTESRQANGIVYLAFASAVMDGTNPPEMQICARVRLTLPTAQGLREALGRMVDEALRSRQPPKAN
jgi:hypothetical protein